MTLHVNTSTLLRYSLYNPFRDTLDIDALRDLSLTFNFIINVVTSM